MRRFWRNPMALFGVFFALALLVLLPMRLALEAAGLGANGLAARQVSGSLWAGRLDNARLGDVALGDVAAGVSPLQLLAGRARITLAGRALGTDHPLAGAVAVSRHSFALDDVSAAVAARRAFAPLPVSKLELEGVSVRFEGAACAQASGRVRATLSGGVGAIPLPSAMSGAARCEGGKLLLPLVGQAGAEAVHLRIAGDGSYRAELIVQPGDPALGQQLALAGFQPTPTGYALSVGGHF